MQYGVIGTDGRGRRMVDIDVTSSRTIHDFSLTDAYVVVYDLPITSSQGWADDNPHRWDPGAPALVGVMPRDGDAADMWWTGIDPCFVFHTLDAFEDGDRIVVDLLRHPDAFSSYLLGSDGAPRPSTGGRSTWRSERCPRSASTTAPRSCRASTSAASAAGTASATRWGPRGWARTRYRLVLDAGTLDTVAAVHLPRPGALRVLRQMDRRRLIQSADRIRTTVRARPG